MIWDLWKDLTLSLEPEFDVDTSLDISYRFIHRLLFCYFLINKNIISVRLSNSESLDIKDIFGEITNIKIISKIINYTCFKSISEIDKELYRYEYRDQHFLFEVPFLGLGLFNEKQFNNTSNRIIKESEVEFKDFEFKNHLNSLLSFNYNINEIEDSSGTITPRIFAQILEKLSIELDKENFESICQLNEYELDFDSTTKNKSDGVFFTPAKITDLITEKTILSYINQQLNLKKNYTRFDLLLDDLDPSLKDKLKSLLDNLSILDISVGAGEFLISAASTLFRFISNVGTGQDEYTVRCNILRNLNGTDTLRNAIEVTKLRLYLWASNAYNKNAGRLTSLEYNIQRGNSLLGFTKYNQAELSNELSTQIQLRNKLVLQYNSSISDTSVIQELVERIKKVTDQIDKLLNNLYFNRYFPNRQYGLRGRDLFHFISRFSHVVYQTGFQICIGNPPYYKVQRNSPVKNLPEFTKVKYRRMNISSIFLMRLLKLVDQNASVGLILPKNLAYTQNWKNVRNYLFNECSLEYLIDCKKAFGSVKLEQLIIILHKEPKNDKSNHQIQLSSLDDTKHSLTVPQSLMQKDNIIILADKEWVWEVKKLVEKSTHTKLGEISEMRLGLGIQGKNYVSDKFIKGHIKAIGGNDIQRYQIRNCQYVDPDQLKHNDLNFLKKLQKPHIVVQRIVAHIQDRIKLTATIDKNGHLTFNTILNIFPEKKYEIKYLLGIINSNLIQFYVYKFIYSSAIRSIDFYESYANKIPLPSVNNEQQLRVAKIIDKLMKLNSDHSSDKTKLEAQLNNLIYKHFNIPQIYIGKIEETMK